MKLTKCNKCGTVVEMDDNEKLIIHTCGSSDVEDVTDKVAELACGVVTGSIGLLDAIARI